VNQDNKQILSSFISRHPWRSKLRYRPWSQWQHHHSESVASALTLRRNQISPSAKCSKPTKKAYALITDTSTSQVQVYRLHARRVANQIEDEKICFKNRANARWELIIIEPFTTCSIFNLYLRHFSTKEFWQRCTHINSGRYDTGELHIRRWGVRMAVTLVWVL